MGTTVFPAVVAFDAGIGADPKRVGCFSFGWSMVAIRLASETMAQGSQPKPQSQQRLTIRNPDRGFMTVADECIALGSFDTAIARIRDKLVEAALDRDTAKASYYNRAFLAFLRAKGGNYALRPSALPAAAFEPPDG